MYKSFGSCKTRNQEWSIGNPLAVNYFPRGGRLNDEVREPRGTADPMTPVRDVLAGAAGERARALVPLKDIRPLTGYIRGGVSALGAKKALSAFIDASALELPIISVSGGMRGLQIFLCRGQRLQGACAQGRRLIIVGHDQNGGVGSYYTVLLETRRQLVPIQLLNAAGRCTNHQDRS